MRASINLLHTTDGFPFRICEGARTKWRRGSFCRRFLVLMRYEQDGGRTYVLTVPVKLDLPVPNNAYELDGPCCVM
jgi:hypothetical protein